MSNKIIVIVKSNVIEGKEKELDNLATELVNKTQSEAGCESYEVYRSGACFIFLEQWKNQNYLDEHLKTEHVAAYIPKIKDCLVGGKLNVQIIEVEKSTNLAI